MTQENVYEGLIDFCQGIDRIGEELFFTLLKSHPSLDVEGLLEDEKGLLNNILYQELNKKFEGKNDRSSIIVQMILLQVLRAFVDSIKTEEYLKKVFLFNEEENMNDDKVEETSEENQKTE